MRVGKKCVKLNLALCSCNLTHMQMLGKSVWAGPVSKCDVIELKKLLYFFERRVLFQTIVSFYPQINIFTCFLYSDQLSLVVRAK